jgi:threonine/homoserine/homoserine lactone efflux protein
MFVYLLIEGVLIGIMIAVPVGPLGLLCINRALAAGALCGLVSGLAVASADAMVAGIVALGISLISGFLLDHQFVLRLVGGVLLCCLGVKIYNTKPKQGPLPSNVNGLFGTYATTFLLTLSNPVTVLQFIAIYAGWGVTSLSGHYFAAAILTLGVFTGSAFWWIALFVGLTMFHHKFTLEVVGWIHRISGAVIAGAGFIILLSLSPLKSTLGIQF